MPNKKGSKQIKSTQKSKNKSRSKSVKNTVQDIQSANHLARNRLIRFTDVRTYIVDDAEGLISSYPPNIVMACNDPNNAFVSNVSATPPLPINGNGYWYPTDLGATGEGMSNLNEWICANGGLPVGGGRGFYKQAQCLSNKIKVTAIPMPEDKTADAVQDVVLMTLSATSDPMSKNRNHNLAVSSTSNGQVARNRYYTKNAQLYRNHGGTPTGATITMNYSYKKMNAGLNQASHSIFHNGSVPAQQDSYELAFWPGHSAKYGNADGGSRLPQLRVTIQQSYIVLLSEPNTYSVTAKNIGNDLTTTAQISVPQTLEDYSNVDLI